MNIKRLGTMGAAVVLTVSLTGCGSGTPPHVQAIVEKLESSGIGCDTPSVVLDNNYVSEPALTWDQLQCSNLEEEFMVFDDALTMEVFQSQMCGFAQGREPVDEEFATNWILSDNVMLLIRNWNGDVSKEYADELGMALGNSAGATYSCF
jgi:hypothetical protein